MATRGESHFVSASFGAHVERSEGVRRFGARRLGDFSAGGGVVPRGCEGADGFWIGDVRAHAEALRATLYRTSENVNEALFALEQAASTHQVAAAFSGVRVSVPVRSNLGGAGGGFTWSPLFDEL